MKSDEIRLGRKAIAALINMLSGMTHSEIDMLLFKHDLNRRCHGKNKLDKLGNVFYPLVDEEEYNMYQERNDPIEYINFESEANNAKGLFEEKAQELVSVLEENHDERAKEQAKQQIDTLQQALRADGHDLIKGRVVRFLSPSVDPGQEQGLLESRLNAAGFKVDHNHLIQSVNNAASGNWEAANGQLRSFLEGLCDDIAGRLYDEDGEAPTSGRARQFLKSVGFLTHEESDLLESFFKVLHGEGSHPGKSSEADCHRRRLMAVALANYYLDRLDEWPKQASA